VIRSDNANRKTRGNVWDGAERPGAERPGAERPGSGGEGQTSLCRGDARRDKPPVRIASEATPDRSPPKVCVCPDFLYALYSWPLHPARATSRRTILFPLRWRGVVLASRAWSQLWRLSP